MVLQRRAEQTVTSHERDGVMPQSDRERTEAYRGRLRALGMRPLQVWVPNIHRPGFAAEVRRQVALLRDQAEKEEAMDFIEAAQDTRGWE